jgi:16S rRNA (cytidine1402-2'-O)-methyltransferase
MSGTLYVVATPIGNLGDLTPRAVEILKSVDYILAEDTRVTLKILQHTGIQKKLISYSEHSSDTKDKIIIANLLNGESYALVSDAGTPGVSDPGARIVGLAVASDISVVPLPGASAVTTVVSVFGKPTSSFHFWGFFPQKLKKQKALVDFFQTIPGIHVFFESPFRILKTLEAHFQDLNDFDMVMGREVTKKFETFYRGTPLEVLTRLKDDPVKGEFCVALMKKDGKDE